MNLVISLHVKFRIFFTDLFTYSRVWNLFLPAPLPAEHLLSVNEHGVVMTVDLVPLVTLSAAVNTSEPNTT